MTPNPHQGSGFSLGGVFLAWVRAAGGRYVEGRKPEINRGPHVACVTHVVDASDNPGIVFLFPWDYLNVHHYLNSYYRHSIHYF